jgi:hypothetical protein
MDRDGNLKHSIFHDPLGNLGDYSKGIYYQGRRKYLYNEDKRDKVMEPPKEMMTNRQKRKSNIHSTKGVQLIQKLEFKRQTEAEARAATKKVDNGKKKTNVIITITATKPDDWSRQSQAGCVYWVHTETGEIRLSCPFDHCASSPSSPPSQRMPSIERAKSHTERTNLFVRSSSGTSDQTYAPNFSRGNTQSLSNPIDDGLIVLSERTNDDEETNTDVCPQLTREKDADDEEATGALIYESGEYLELMKSLDLMAMPRQKSGENNTGRRRIST